MTTTLAFDASTGRGTIAVLADDRVVAEAQVAMRGEATEHLMPAVVAALGKSGAGLADVDRIVCGAGPGSFTSLRIAASLAKGMALGAEKPLFAVSSLALIVAGNAQERTGRYLAVLDALRDQCFAASFEITAGRIHVLHDARLVSRSEVAGIAEREGSRVVGPDEAGEWRPHARGVGALNGALVQGPVNLTDWEPAYGRLAEAQVRWEAAHGGTLPR